MFVKALSNIDFRGGAYSEPSAREAAQQTFVSFQAGHGLGMVQAVVNTPLTAKNVPSEVRESLFTFPEDAHRLVGRGVGANKARGDGPVGH